MRYTTLIGRLSCGNWSYWWWMGSAVDEHTMGRVAQQAEPTAVERSVGKTLLRLACFMLPALAVLPLTLAMRRLPLDGPVALAAYGLSESGGWIGIGAIAVVMIALTVGRRGISWGRRFDEGALMLAALIVVLGGGAYLNEHVVKPAFGVPRPNVRELAGAGVLKMTAQEFYSLGDKPARSRYLAEALPLDGFDAVPPAAKDAVKLHRLVREHWIAETGFSFPSGHSFSAMFFATFCLAAGLSFCARPRVEFFYILVPWAVLVCYSRVALRVHSPADVCCGGLAGVILGMLTFTLFRCVLRRQSPERSLPS